MTPMGAEETTRVCKLVEDTVEQSINSFFINKDVKVTHVLDLIFPKERRIRSLIGGLEGSLGTRVWEPLAKTFAAESGFTVHNEKHFNDAVPVIPEELRNRVSNFQDKKRISPKTEVQNFVTEVREFAESLTDSEKRVQTIPQGEGIDIWLSRYGVHYLIDIKTTQINAGSGPKFLSNQLNWVCYQILKDPQSQVEPILAFPFNPHPCDYWQKETGKVSPLIPRKEARVADEFWDFLLEAKGTTSLIIKAFENIGKRGFGKKFDSFFDPSAKQTSLDI